ncbi:hypothetical protein EWE75_20360 [Sphingomonas populi]|uniref:Autotransporter domain-containing protein n=1 Tax=Sphingomonas populi TaxID=2484750 RepID=A0A4Q6XLT3_9SPHN|nr:autotransporter-associated beta strand repeat-containing protein [Sphingomonas populi]RZF60953.1 hypothetical protein EWE75_20360 [Sphingomonas populi]
MSATTTSTTCSGAVADGVQVTTANASVNVATDAHVSNVGAPAILVDVPILPNTFFDTTTLTVIGAVSAQDQSAVVVTSGTSSNSFSYKTVSLTVGAGGSVSGATAFALVQSAGNATGTIDATIDNAGTITGSGGTALIGNAVTNRYGYTSPLTTFSSITNRASGTITGSIVGAAPLITNAGTIDGGTQSAIDSRLGASSNITNAAGGAIRSTSDSATILTGATNPYYGSNSTISNSGIITNAGSGAAVSGLALTVKNAADGQISTSGVTAISATTINLVNQGLVTGSIVASNGSNTIDSGNGAINGSVTLGNGNNTLVARYVGRPALATGIAGTLTVGGTGNIERLAFSTDTAVTTPVQLDSGFQQLVLAPDAKVTATLEAGFSSSAPIVLSGQGTVINRATLNVGASGVRDSDYTFGSAAAFINEGTISATATSNLYSPFAVSLSNHSFTNTATVIANGGGGINMSFNPVNNSGTIISSGTGAFVFDGVLTNSGTIISTAGDGAYLIGNVGYTGSNSGLIQGATSGVTTSVYFTNTGTINSTGVGVNVQPYGYLINGATGVVNGGSGGAVSVGSFNAGVANAGMINGNVTFFGSGNYIALSGGTLNGNLVLGGGATLVTDLVNTGSGQFAGITGTVTADKSATLRYVVSADTVATLPTTNVGPFAGVGYQLSDGAKLTLTAPADEIRTTPLLLAGNGVVDLEANLAVSDAVAVQSVAAVTYPGAPATTGTLSIISRGSVSLTRTDRSVYNSAAFSLSATDSFTNFGDISVTDRIGYNTAAIAGGVNITNAGRITLDGGVGITGSSFFGPATVITNSGTIVQRDGGQKANGVVGFTTLVNDGTIAVGAAAVQFSVVNGATASLVNTGTLISTGGAAITDYTISYGTEKITNQASGTINGVGRAIQTAYASLTNAGTINGTVDLGYLSATSRSYTSAVYVAAGGTINGDLLFGSGSDLLLQTGETLGVSGIVDGGDGRNIYGQSRSASGSVAIDPTGLRNFQDVLVEAKGVGTVVTATGTLAGNLYAVGDGAIVNQASIGGALMANSPFSYGPATFDQVSSLTNSGSVAGGVSGALATFTNSGTIGSSNLAGAALYLTGDTLNIDNSGVIASAGALSPYFYSVSAYLNASTSITINNSGTIGDAGLYARTSPQPDVAGALALTNSGTISNKTGRTAVDLEMGGFFGNSVGGAVSLTNAGTISSQGAPTGAGGAVGVVLAAYGASQPVAIDVVNTGTISAAAVQPLSGEAGSAIAMEIVGNGAGMSTLSNALGGTIAANGPGRAIGLVVVDTSLSLTNAGTIVAAGGTSSTAIQTFDNYANTIRNTGIITGDLRLAAGGDVVDNAGTITGTVALGDGDDVYIQRGSGSVIGTIDGGSGIDTIALESSGTNHFAGATNFEKLAVNTGSWTLTGAQTYSGGATIAAGANLTVTAPPFGSNVSNAGTIIFDQANNGAFANTVSGTGALSKIGGGRLMLGAQTYTGATNVYAGALELTGNLAAGTYTVASGATLTSALSATLSTSATNVAITNAGTISDANASGRAINLAGSNNARTIVITNAAGGVITSADDAVRVNFNPSGGSIRVDNAGTIRTTNGGQALDFDAAASGKATIIINNYETGVIRSFGQDAIRPGQGAIVTNAGLIASDGAPNNNYDGIDWQGKAGTVVNLETGTISGLRHGITSDTDVNVTNAGLIRGRNGSGIGSDGTGTVVNTGTITGRWDGVATNGDGDGIDIDFIGSVTNSGTIQGLSANGVDSGGRPNSAEGIAMGGGAIVNTAGASIYGAGNAVLINHDTNAGGVADGATSITNAGAIRAGSGYAISLVGAFDDTIVNAGTITGGSAGAIDMGAGNDTLMLLPDSVITGTVDGGAGTDRVVLGGTGAGSFAGAVNFETLAVASGNWTLTAPATFANGTSIAAAASLTGTSATLTGSIADAGTLIFNQTHDGSLAASLSGSGQLVKTGAGTLITGDQARFTGATLVNAGRLVLAGTLPSAVTVASGAALAGNGTVASLAIAAGGTVAPGNSPGTIVVAGSFTQAVGSTYAADITAAGASDHIIVGGTATLANGALLTVTRDAGTYRIGQRYTLLTAAGGIDGTYTLVQSPSGGTEFRLVRTINGISVDLARTGASLVTTARTGNQMAVANSFGALDVTNAAYAALTLNPDDAAVRSALNSLSGEVHASLRTGMLKDAQAGEEAVRGRTLSQSVGNGIWGQISGLFGTDAATRDAAAVKRNGYGVFGGVDAAIGTRARAGLAGGYTRTSFTIDGRASRGTIKTKQVLGYASGTFGAIALRASVGYAWADTGTARRVAFAGYTASHDASYDGGVLHGMVEVGVKRPLLGGTVEPFAGVEAYRVRSDAFAETGATTALIGRAKSETFTLTDLGMRADTPIVAGVSAHTQVGWRRVIGDARPSATLQFAGTDVPFTVAGAGLSRDSATMALDLEWKPVERLSIVAGYSGSIGGNGADDSRLRLTASLAF